MTESRPARSARAAFGLARAAAAAVPLLAAGMAALPPREAQAQSPQPRPPTAGSPPAATSPAAPNPAPVDRTVLLILVRSTLLALQHGNDTGNYTVLRDLGAPGFQAANTAARLAEIFASLRNPRVDLSSVAVLEPQIVQGPLVDKDGLLRLAGFFSSGGERFNFELAFQTVDGRLRLFGISTGLGQSAAAPAAAPAPAPAGAAPDPKPAAAPTGRAR